MKIRYICTKTRTVTEQVPCIAELNAKETKQFKTWFARHSKKCEHAKKKGEKAVAWNYRSNGIGPIYTATCCCGESKEVADVDSW